MSFPADLFARTKGFLKESEGRCLYETALEAARLGPCLEIGGYCGKSTLCIGAACKERGAVLFSVDHHQGSEEQQPGEEYFDPELFDGTAGRIDTFRIFRQTLERAGLEQSVVPIVCGSSVAARQWATPLSMVFIDGGHSFSDACTDYNGWAGYIVAGGRLAIHDIFLDPAEGGQAPHRIYRLALASGLFAAGKMVDTLGMLRRVSPGQIPDEARRSQ
ncbi:MAG: class I SAM-dependent methyltransferase [Desulfobacterales bacterium]|nr:class I SAM-dependent methyltransferase [Desulfobacterales bacterium]